MKYTYSRGINFYSGVSYMLGERGPPAPTAVAPDWRKQFMKMILLLGIEDKHGNHRCRRVWVYKRWRFLRRAQPWSCYPCGEKCWTSGREGSEFVDHLSICVIGGRDGGAVIVNNGVYNEHLVQTVSVTSQVAVSRLVHKYKLKLRGIKRPERGGKRRGGWRWWRRCFT